MPDSFFSTSTSSGWVVFFYLLLLIIWVLSRFVSRTIEISCVAISCVCVRDVTARRRQMIHKSPHRPRGTMRHLVHSIRRGGQSYKGSKDCIAILFKDVVWWITSTLTRRQECRTASVLYQLLGKTGWKIVRKYCPYTSRPYLNGIMMRVQLRPNGWGWLVNWEHRFLPNYPHFPFIIYSS